jgi:hypothetical protein
MCVRREALLQNSRADGSEIAAKAFKKAIFSCFLG